MKKLLYSLIFASSLSVVSAATPAAQELATSGVIARYTAHRTIKNFLIKPLATLAVHAAACSATICFDVVEDKFEEKLKAAGIGSLMLAGWATIWLS